MGYNLPHKEKTVGQIKFLPNGYFLRDMKKVKSKECNLAKNSS